MPRPGPRRPQVAIRLSEEKIAEIDAFAEAEKANRSEIIRRLVDEALAAREAVAGSWPPPVP
jgi:metal-responsive CopG/Arc/MetJ family transcriptional regulator